MALDRRTLLSAIAAETADRSGPMPVWLVPVAPNVRGKRECEWVDAEVLALRREQLIECQRVNGASGILLTDAGRAELRELNAGKPPKRATSPPPPPPSPATTVPEPEAVSPATFPVAESPLTLTPVDPTEQPALYGLLCGCAELVAGSIAEALERQDAASLPRLRRLGAALLQATGRSV